MNTAPTSSGCLLLIDSRVTDYQDIINAKQTGVQHIVFHVEDIFHVEDMNTEANPFEYIQTRISELGVSAYTNVGLIQHNMRLPVYSMFGSGSGSGSFDATIADVETVDPTLQTWAGVSGFITHLKNTYGVQNFDMMACALYSNLDWKYVIDTLAVQTGVTVRASTDDTGAGALGGDWFLESHTGVNLKDVYFTEAIEDFRGVLIYSTKYNTSSLFSTKSMAVGKAVAWGATNYGGGTDVNTITGGVITSGVVALYSTGNAFAALKTNGSVSTWGANGGNQTVGGTSPSVASSLTSGVVEIYTNEHALAALKSDGTVITWGFGSYGGSSTSVDLTNVVDIFSGKYAFAALKSNGSLVTWPSSSIYGGNSSTAASGLTSGVVSVNMAIKGVEVAAAALKSDGSVVTWPTSSTTGGNSTSVASDLFSGVVVVYSDNYTFAALKNNGSVINWGDTTYALDGNTYVAATSVTLSNIVTINNGAGAYAALNTNGGVVTWGLDYTGGNSSGKSLSSNVVKVYNSLYAFAALKFDGSVVTWGGYTGDSAYGGNSTSVASDLSSGVVAVYGNNYAFAALKSNGKVITWGDPTYGGTSSSVATDISAGIVGIYVTQTAFAALRNDGKLITWGDSTPGGNSSSVSTDLSAGVVSVNNTISAFAAITSTATTFDLSMSYYRDIDRYNILRNKENRRRVNLTTLNNNVFTLSSARDIQKFNYTIPSGNSFRIIVPDYVSSNYSIISTATLPSPAAANYIIACDEGEPVTISGVTYINYGAFVYRRNVADNTFTKMTSAVIDGVTYNLYGGDGLFSSGIAFQYRFGTFTMPAKAFGDASFNITAPVTDSSGAFTYTSSNTAVATVTTGGVVTIAGIGTTTITATQAASGIYTAADVSGSLVVNFGNTNTITRLLTGGASVIPTPVSNVATTYGSTWNQLDVDIVGKANGDESGTSISASADGTIVAIGARSNTTNRGTVRVYQYEASDPLYAFTSFTFDNAGKTGQTGPNLTTCRTYYAANRTNAAWTQDLANNYLNMTTNGIQLWTVPATGSYTIRAAGARGGVGGGGGGGYGIDVLLNTTLQKGDVIKILCGQEGRSYVQHGSGGGGTFVVKDTTAIIVAGGGGGRVLMEGNTSSHASNGTAGKAGYGAVNGFGSGGSGGSGGSSGYYSAGGGGLTGNGADNTKPLSGDVGGGLSFNSGGLGGFTSVPNSAYYSEGGFGGGGASAINGGGGGGGYSGGGGGGGEGEAAGGGGGGSYGITTLTDNGMSYATHGSVTITANFTNFIWGQIGADINGEASSDYSGQSVSLSANGRVVAIGANMNDGSGNLAPDSGHVRIYEFNGTNWVQRGGDIDGEANGNQSGISVSLSEDGNIVAIGAIMNDGSGNALSNSGHVRVYKYNASKTSPQLTDQSLSTFGPVGWDRLGADIDGEAVNDQSGFSVSLSADGATLAIGANFNDGTSGTVDTSNNRGHVRVYRYNASKTNPQLTNQSLTTFGPVGWDRMGSDIDGEVAADQSGFSVSLSADGSAVAIGSPLYDVSGVTNAGRVRVFAWNGSSWAQRGQNINGVNLNENIGDSVSLSADGSILSVSSFMKVVNYNYNSSTNTWSQIGSEIANVGNTLQTYRVSLSSQGNILAVGAREYDGTTGASTNIGVARVYRIDTSGNYTYSSSNTALADVCGNIIIPKSMGSTTIAFTQSASGATASRSGTIPLTISGITPTIGALTAPAKNFGDASFNLTAPTSDSGGAFTYASSNTAAATVTSGGTVTVVGAGTTTITATQAANGNYTTGSVTASLVVSPIAPTIGALTAPAKNFGDASFNLTAPSSNSGGAFTYASSNTAVATVTSGGTVTVVGAGSTTITATQASTTNYTGGSVTASLVVSAIAPTIGALTTPAKNFGDASFNLTAPSSNSDGAITYTSSAEGVATVTSGGTVTVVGAGSTTITATQAATTNYTGGSVTASLVVSPIAPTLGALTAPAKNFGDASFNLASPTSNSGGAITYTSSVPAVATVSSGGMVTVVGAGSTTITATQAATTNYTGGSVTASLVVSPIAPTIGALSAPAKNFGDASFNLTAPSSNSDGAITYTSSAEGVATVTSGGTVTVVGAGSTTITASQAATTNYTGGSVTASLVVSPIAPTIGALSAPAKNFGDASFNLTAPSSNSDGAITYTSSAPAVATISTGGTVTVVGAGTTTITASQAATTNYTGGSVTASLVVSPIAPTIGALTAPAKNFADASFNLTAPSSNSDGAITYTSSAEGVATVTSGGTVTVVGAGSTTITATQAATTNYTGGSVTASLVVSPITPTYQSISQITKTYSTDVSFSLTAVMSGVSNSSGAYAFSSTSAAIDICGGVATILAYTPSAITITATQAASGNYNGAGSTTFTLLVNRKVPSYGAFSVPAKTYEDAPFSIAAYAPTTDSVGVPFTYTSSEPTVATINSDGTVATIIGHGYTTITASQEASGNYAASSITTSFLVNRAAPTFLKAFTIPNKTFGDASFSLLPFTEGLDNTDGTYHFTSSNAELVTISEVDSVTATILAYTPTPITIYVAIDACGNYAASSTSGTLTVARAAPSIGALTAPAKNFGDAAFDLTAPSSNSGGAITYTSSAPGVATVGSGGRVTIVGAGSTTITATQAASGNYTGGSVTASLVVSPIAPTIGTLTAPAKNFGDASFNLTAPSSNSGGSFTYTSSVPAVATVSSGGTVIIVGAGSTTITATQDASGNYTGGSSVTASLVVSPIAPTIGALTTPAKNFGDASFNLTAPSSNSDGAITYTSSVPAVATVSSGGMVTVVGAGSTTITATQAATTNYTGGSVTASLVVSPIAPTIGALTAPAKNFGDASFNLTAPSSNSDGAITYTSSNAAVATVTSGGAVTVVGAGSTTITASQAATTNYTVGSVTASLVVSPIAPTIGDLTAPTKNFGDAAFNLASPTSNSSGAFSYTSSNAAVATVTSGGTVTVVGAGTTTITASQAATTNYTTGSVTASLVVSPIAPTIGALSAPAKNFGDASFNLTAPSSNSAGVITYTSSVPAVATVTSGGTVTVVGAGSTTITATQDASGNYTGGSVTASLVVSPIAPTIGTLTAPAKNFGDASFNLTAPSSNSDGAITYTSSAEGVATVGSGGTVTVVGAGTTTITATQAATTNYTGGSVTASLVVSPIAPTIGALTAPAKNFRDESFNLASPTSNSGGAFSYTSSNAAVATVTSGGTVTVVGAGTTTITASQAATTNYTTGSVTASLVVSPIAPTIGALSAPAKNFGDASFNLTDPSSNSAGVITYTSSVPAVATVSSGGTVTVVGAGITTIRATQAATTNYTSGLVSTSLVVSPIAPTIGALTAPAKNFADASFNLTAPSSNSGGAFSYTSSNAAVATITSGGTVTVVGAGSTTITATQAATTNYTGGSVTASLVVSPIAPTIGALSAPAKNFADASFNLTAPSSNSGGAFSYTSSNAAVATVTSGGTVTIVGAGSTTITATQAASADGNYTGGSSVTASLVVSAITPTYQSISQITKIYSTDVSFSLTSIMSGVSNSSGAYTFSTTSAAIDICGGVATILAYTPSAITITATQAASGNYNALGSTTFAVLVNRKVPSYGEFSVPAATYENAPFSIAAYAPTTDSVGVPFTYTSSEPTVATINSDGTVITIIGQGYTTITASQAAGGNYAANSITTSFLVNRAAPTFLKAFTITNKTFGDASFSLLPFTEGLDNTDGTYHFTSSNAQLVSISEIDSVTATIHAYTPTPITIYVAIDACGNYAASSTSGTLTVIRAIPTFGAFTVPTKNFRDASFNITAPTSNSSGTFTYSSSNTSVATVTSGGVLTVVSAGSTTITATQEINGNYTTRDISASLVVSPIAPTIGALTAPAKNFGDASFNLTAPTSDSDGAITYTSSNTAVATVTSGGTVTVVGVGSTTITATQAATTNYSGGSVTASLVVSASLSNFSVPGNKYYGDASFNLVDPDTTDNTVGFTFASSNTSVATLSGTGGRTVTIVGAGSTTITATQAATANRGELNISATLVVHPATPVITLAPIAKSYGNSSFRLSPSSTNTDTTGGSVFTFSSDNISVVSFLDASLVRINGIGTATIAITQAASANFTDASSSVVITVNKGASGFSASTFAVAANKTFGDAAFAITTVPISSSTGAITYASSDEAVAVITSSGSGNAITLVGQGTVTFTASQAASALYTADTKTSNTLTVARKTAALSRDTPSTDTITKYYGSANFSVIATNESNGAFSFTSSDPSFATIDASTGEVSIVAVGSTTLTATRSQTAQYNVSSVSWTLNIARGTTTLTGLTSMTRNVTVAPFTVTATSASNAAVSYALQDPSSTILTIHPTTGLVILLSPGSAVIVASQAQGTLYEAPSSITATITVSEAGNILEGATLTNSINYANVDLSGASLTNTNITNTNFSSGSLNNANMNSATITNSNMTSTDLSGATMRNATITGTDFTSANLRRTDLSGANVRNSIFNSAELSGSTLIHLDASGASFINANLSGANLSNADFTNANMTNANIDGADITNVTFTTPQKLQLLKGRGNRVRSEIQVSQVLGSVLLPILSAGSTVRDVSNIANATFKVMIPSTSLVASDSIIDIELDIANFTNFYLPIGENEYFKIQGVKYYISGSTILNYATGAYVEIIYYGVKAIRLLAGSLTVIVNSQNTLSTSSFVVPTPKINTDAPFSPTTLPTSNSTAPIVYSSSNTSIATIHSSTGVITPVGGSSGFVRFTASQVVTQTHEAASIMSNELLVNRLIDFTLVGLNQTFSLSTLATLDASSISLESTDATAVFYVRLSDMTNLFQYQTDSFDVNNVDASDIKYYMFHRSTPAEFHINPSHAMMNKTESAGMIGSGVQEITANKSLVKHDFIRYIALRLFGTHHGVDLFQNEQELHENLTYLGETIRHNIDNIITGVSTTSASESMAYDASGNKYLTNDASGNTNLCRELMRQVAASDPARFYNNGGNTTGVRNMPLQEDDSINFKLTITAAAGQNILTGVSVIPSRTYMIKMMLKNTVNTSSNDTNTAVTDSEMYPNSYPYSTSVTTYAPTVDSSGVYNVYSPPAPIPLSRFGFNGWYYANTSAWVNVAPQVRDRVKWIVPSNSVGSSTVSNLQYIRMNLKVFNKTSLPFLVVYTQAGSYRKYTISAPNSLANGTVYSFYMNFNSYSREPATVGATNAALTYSGVSNGSFADSEIISSIAIESDNSAAASSVEFTLSRIVVGVAGGEKEYGFSGGI